MVRVVRKKEWAAINKPSAEADESPNGGIRLVLFEVVGGFVCWRSPSGLRGWIERRLEVCRLRR
jgi:hypothetical protein